MSAITARYDRSALAYDRYWGPVLRPSALALLDRTALLAERDGMGSPRRVLDLGAGTGVLAIAAARRWPSATVVGLDGSRAMLEVAADRARRELGPVAASRVEWRTGLAEALPLPDASVDVVVSSFVVQLVPHRPTALREALRVLRPGGRLAYVTWLDASDDFAPQVVVDEVLDELGPDDGDAAEEDRAGDVASPAAAAAELRRAGYRTVSAHESMLVHRWTARSFLEYVERYDAAESLRSLPAAARRAARERLDDRLGRLGPEDFVWRTPVVSATGRRPGP